MSRVDLQLHSTFSDGHDSPQQLVTRALKHGVEVISVTDHDTVRGSVAAMLVANDSDVVVVAGVEVTTVFRGKTLHVLAYGFDVEDEDFLLFLDSINASRREQLVSQVPVVNANLRRASLPEIDREHYACMDSKYFSYPGLATYLSEQGIVDAVKDGFALLSGVDAQIPAPEPQVAFDMIHAAGGVAVLAHPLAPHISLVDIVPGRDGQREVISLLVQQGLDGLEVFGTGHNNDDVLFAQSLVEEFGLLMTAGSDWHGPLELTGDGVKKLLPFYLEEFGSLNVPESAEKVILSGLGLKDDPL